MWLPAADASRAASAWRPCAINASMDCSSELPATAQRWYQSILMHERSAHRSLLIVGSVALDDIDGPFGAHSDLLGGSASFIARAAAYFTRQVSIVGVIGDDFPQRHIDELV